MDRYQVKDVLSRRVAAGCTRLMLAAVVMLFLPACDDGPRSPRPPSPPRPVTFTGPIDTTHFELPGRPVPPPLGMM